MRTIRAINPKYFHARGQEIYISDTLSEKLGTVGYFQIKDIIYIVPVNHIVDLAPLTMWDDHHKDIFSTCADGCLELIGTGRPGWWLISNVR